MGYFFLIGVIVLLLIVIQNDSDEYNNLVDDCNNLIEDRDYYKDLVTYWNDHEWYDT